MNDEMKKTDALEEAMELAGMHLDRYDSSPDSLRFTSEEGIVTYFDGWDEVVNWLEGTVFDDPELELEIDELLTRAKELEPITVIQVEPGKAPVTIRITTDLESLQKAVGGDIEVVYPFEEEVAIICNEEGKINGLPLNRALYDDRGKIYDVVAGTFLVTGLTEDSFGSLTPEQIDTYTQMYQTPEAFMRMGRDIVAIPIAPEGEKVNPLAKVEEILEDDYGMIDGIINNGPRKEDDTKGFDKTENKRSIHDRLEKGKETVKAYDRARGEETKTVSKGEREI